MLLFRRAFSAELILNNARIPDTRRGVARILVRGPQLRTVARVPHREHPDGAGNEREIHLVRAGVRFRAADDRRRAVDYVWWIAGPMRPHQDGKISGG